jgi:hypothetical protein
MRFPGSAGPTLSAGAARSTSAATQVRARWPEVHSGRAAAP